MLHSLQNDEYIAALYYNRRQQLIIDIYQKEKWLKQIVMDYPAYISKIDWSKDSKRLVFLNTRLRGNIEILNWRTEKITTILTATSDDIIKDPIFYQNYLLYVSSYSGIENIYAYHLKNKKRFRVTSRPIAAINPNVYQDTLYFNDVDYNLEAIAQLELDPNKWQTLSQVQRFILDDANPLQKKLAASNLIDSFAASFSQKAASFQQPRPQKPLNRFLKFNPFAFHSLSTSFLNNQFSLTLNGDDNFYTTSSLSVMFTGLNLSQLVASLKYSGFYPILSSSLTYENFSPLMTYLWQNNISLPFFFINTFRSASLWFSLPIVYQYRISNAVSAPINSIYSGLTTTYNYSQYGYSFSLAGSYFLANDNQASDSLLRISFNASSRIITQKDLLAVKWIASYHLNKEEDPPYLIPTLSWQQGSVFGDNYFNALANQFNFASLLNLRYNLPPLPIDAVLIPTTWPVWSQVYLRSMIIGFFYEVGYIKNISILSLFSELFSSSSFYNSQSIGAHCYFKTHFLGQNTVPLDIGFSVYYLLNIFAPSDQLNYSFYFNVNF